MNTIMQQESFEKWLARRYGSVKLDPKHIEFARTVYEEEKRTYGEGY